MIVEGRERSFAGMMIFEKRRRAGRRRGTRRCSAQANVGDLASNSNTSTFLGEITIMIRRAIEDLIHLFDISDFVDVGFVT